MSDLCPHCRTFAQENEKLVNEVSGLLDTTRSQARTIAALRGQLTKQRNQEILARHVTAILRTWRHWCCKTANISLTTKNAEHVRVAFLNYAEGDHQHRRHLLCDAARGAGLRPYDEGYGKRTANPAKGVRRVTTEHIFASEARIEAFAGYYRYVRAQPEEWVQKVYEAARETQDLWFYLVMQERAHRPAQSPLYVAPPERVDEALHLFVELPQGPAQELPEPSRPQLFIIEGDRDAA
jgi:hypothetical protein